MIKIYFQIARLVFELDSDLVFDINQDFLPFLTTNSGHIDYQVIYRQSDSLILNEKTLVATDYDNEIYVLEDQSFVRQFHQPERKDVYAVSHCYGTKKTEISYLNSGKPFLSRIHQGFRMSCWEAAMNYHNRLLLHASLISTEHGGILFAGPSGIGKSTQADLWVTNRGARLINGDRPILYRKENWIACGSPLAGSSRCCLNESVPVSAIVLLKQASECSVRRVAIAEAFKRLYSLSTVYSWSTEYVERVLAMIQDLITEIPVYELSCTPDEISITTLECVLQGDSSNGTI